MNKIDDILEQLKGQQPVIDDPDALTDRIMASLPEQEAQPVAANAQPAAENAAETVAENAAETVELRWQNHRRQHVRLWGWLSIAASILLIIGIGAHYALDDSPRSVAQSTTVNQSIDHGQLSNRPRSVAQSNTSNQSIGRVQSLNRARPVAQSGMPNQSIGHAQSINRAHPVEEPATLDSDPNLHYASQDLTKDTVPYQNPARVDEFISQLADYHQVKQGQLTCSLPTDSSVVSSVYVFPDKDEINLFSRLLQVACWYDSKAPGYHLNFSQQQFFFELKDMRKQLQYRWIAERINGRILFYSTQAPIGVKESPACYQEYRNELMFPNSINIKTKKI